MRLAFLTNRSYFINFLFCLKQPIFCIFSAHHVCANSQQTQCIAYALSLKITIDSYRGLSVPTSVHPETQSAMSCRNFSQFHTRFLLSFLYPVPTQKPRVGNPYQTQPFGFMLFLFLYLPILFDSLLELRLLLQLWVIFTTQDKTTTTSFLHLGHVFYLLAFFVPFSVRL